MTTSVLYVDDDFANVVVFETFLKNEFPILTARSGAEALEIIKNNEISVLLSDQRMPGMTGVELMEHARKITPDTVRMLVTAYSDIDAAVEAINRGQVHRYLRKPWEPFELKLTITEARQRYIMQQRLSELERRLVATERVYALGVVAAGIAHELRNPMTAVTMNLDMILSNLNESATPDLPHVKRMVEDARLGCKAMFEIVSSIELSTRSRQDTEVDMKEVVEIAATSARLGMRGRGQLQLELQAVPTVKASRTRLGQVVSSLIVNAIQALESKSAERNVVKVLLTSDGKHVSLVVEDNGPGIPADVLTRIFDPFFTTKVDGGTGLGLAISRQIVEEIGGTVTVSSNLGQGTSFRVMLPIAPPRPS